MGIIKELRNGLLTVIFPVFIITFTNFYVFPVNLLFDLKIRFFFATKKIDEVNGGRKYKSKVF